MSGLTQRLFPVLLVLVVVTISGCGGGGGGTDGGMSSGLRPAPEDAVRALVADWATQTSVPAFSMAADGSLQTTYVSTSSLGQITITDLSNNQWQLQVNEITYLTPQLARVSTTYHFATLELGKMLIDFVMQYDDRDRKWLLEDITANTLPGVVQIETGIQGFITDHNDGSSVASAAVVLYDETGQTVVQSTVTDAQGFYRIIDLPPGKYVLVIAKDDYKLYTQPGIIVF